MTPRKLNVFFGRLPYSGNGGTASEVPFVGSWLVETVCKMKSDPRIDRITHIEISDTPVPMVRNQIVAQAKQWGADILVMIDSDMYPDWHLHHDRNSTDKPFWETSFDFIYNNYDKGPRVVAAPYCGPPPCENVYVFRWANWQSGHPNVDLRLEKYEREEAAIMGGIQEAAALPTGLIMYDMRLFDLVDPPYFYYEYDAEGIPCTSCGVRKPGQQSRKASTEDVSSTRDMGLIVQNKLGYNPLFCNWDAWAAHCKPKMVHRPKLINMDQVGWKYLEAVKRDHHHDERLIVFGDDTQFPPIVQQAVRKMVRAAVPQVEVGSEPWQTPLWMLEEYGYTPQTDLLSIRSLVIEEKDRLGREPVVVELGTYIGQSAKAMADAGACVISIDNLKGSPHDVTAVQYAIGGRKSIEEVRKENLGPILGRNVHLVLGDSVEVGKTWRKPIDILYVDADHDYEPTKANIEVWMKHVRPGGIVAGHDYNPAHFPGTVKAVDELFPKGVKTMSSVWWIRKPVEENPAAPLSYPEFEEDVPELVANGYAG